MTATGKGKKGKKKGGGVGGFFLPNSMSIETEREKMKEKGAKILAKIQGKNNPLEKREEKEGE